MPRKKNPGLFDSFRGLWRRGHRDSTPKDHLADCLNNTFVDGQVCLRDGTTEYLNVPFVLRAHLYKPNPPFTTTNKPRLLYLNAAGVLYDSNDTNTPLDGNIAWQDFSLVNFFGRAYISFSDGRVGCEGFSMAVYDGTGPSGFRTAGGAPASSTIIGHLDTLGNGTLEVGTYLVSYALETSTGFITKPAPFIAVDCFGASQILIDTLPLGPAGTVARWIIASKSIPLRQDLTQPFDVASAPNYDLFFVTRIGNNTQTTYALSFYDETLVDSANYLFTLLEQLPCGVGLLDYKGRLISYGEFADPSIVRVSGIGEPEAFSATSGFFITDPSDSTGVRCATEFRNNLYVFKQQRGYITQDNTLEASTWDVVNFEKSKGTEQYGIAAVLDAKGSSADGFLIADRTGLLYFNGVFAEPELTYKIRDWWLRINENYFYKVQVTHDPINKRIYIVLPLDNSTTANYLLFGDYRDGLNATNIKWSPWQFNLEPRNVSVYTDFTNNIPSLVTRIALSDKIVTLNVGLPSNDDGNSITSFFELAPLRYSEGISQFINLRIRGSGPCNLTFTAYGQDKVINVVPNSLTINSALPGREYSRKFNLVSEHCNLRIESSILNDIYKINQILIEGFPLWDERPS